MRIWLLKFLHLIGMTNLTDDQVRRYCRLRLLFAAVCLACLASCSEAGPLLNLLRGTREPAKTACANGQCAQQVTKQPISVVEGQYVVPTVKESLTVHNYQDLPGIRDVPVIREFRMTAVKCVGGKCR